MTDNGVNSYVWDRANRLLALGGVSYTYNGDGDRVAQTSGVNVTQYLLDLQPGLALVLGDADGNRYVHAPHNDSIHAVSNGAAWTYPLADGLGSVRGYVDANNIILSQINYSEYGVPDMNISGPAFTGEWRSENETQYHRARHLSPGLATWLSLDPFEGLMDRPLSLNGYAWVEGNPVMNTDASGKQIRRDCSRDALSNCSLEGSECEVICLFADQWMETARKFNNPNITNMSNEAFAAMIAAKFIFEDATQFNSQKGLLNQMLSGAGIDPVFRAVWETIGGTGEISYGPGNIPLAQARNAADWWRENAACLGFDVGMFSSGIYDYRIVQQCVPTLGGMTCTIISTPENRASIELNSFDGQTSWDEWLAVTILQSAFRARTISDRNDITTWSNHRVIDDYKNKLSGYIIARAQLDWTATDQVLYDLKSASFLQGAEDWAVAVNSVRDNTHPFWPEMLSLYDETNYRPYTHQERAAFNK
jgi:RHS repeat-associated protein